MATALLGLGSNLGDRAAALEKAVTLLKAEPQIRVEAVSRYRRSQPAGGPEGQGEFLNAAARLETSLSPEELLAKLLAIEDQIGRVRVERWGPRVIDLDLLLYDRVAMKTPMLELPHPRMCYRRFVLEPAAEVASEMVWPVNGWSVEKLHQNLDDSVKYLAISKSSNLDLRDVLLMIELETQCQILSESAEADSLPRNYLEPLTRKVAAAYWGEDAKWRISDFWYDQFYVQFECLAGIHAEATIAMNLWEIARREIVPPRLVVILEDPVHWWILANDTRPSSLTTEFIFDVKPEHSGAHTDFYGRLRQFCRRADCPPTLWLPSEDLELVEHEVLAAMQAME
ncbi:MAG: 2-amino-4-hydroxy-6-hydroxymethyldihydropteridine diphosphokinase [Planctomycetales bacterium]|nr:2-amino-4-hydroxy-6-hydroxymethyldihydropteridine diphosphokinase [Planctomycetales bacterium]